jgi:hypothetical protein
MLPILPPGCDSDSLGFVVDDLMFDGPHGSVTPIGSDSEGSSQGGSRRQSPGNRVNVGGTSAEANATAGTGGGGGGTDTGGDPTSSGTAALRKCVYVVGNKLLCHRHAAMRNRRIRTLSTDSILSGDSAMGELVPSLPLADPPPWNRVTRPQADDIASSVLRLHKATTAWASETQLPPHGGGGGGGGVWPSPGGGWSGGGGNRARSVSNVGRQAAVLFDGRSRSATTSSSGASSGAGSAETGGGGDGDAHDARDRTSPAKQRVTFRAGGGTPVKRVEAFSTPPSVRRTKSHSFSTPPRANRTVSFGGTNAGGSSAAAAATAAAAAAASPGGSKAVSAESTELIQSVVFGIRQLWKPTTTE